MTPNEINPLAHAIESLIEAQARIDSETIYAMEEPFIIRRHPSGEMDAEGRHLQIHYKVIPPRINQLLERGIAPSELALLAAQEVNRAAGKEIFPRSPETMDPKAFLLACQEIAAECIPELAGRMPAIFGAAELDCQIDRGVFIKLVRGDLERPNQKQLQSVVLNDLRGDAISFRTRATSWPAYRHLESRIAGWGLDKCVNIFITGFDALDKLQQMEFLGAALGMKAAGL